MAKISAIVITQNEEQMIANCIDTLRWCDEVVVIDNDSSDRTREYAELAHAKVHEVKDSSFAASRNLGKEKATGDWLLYVDADERVTPLLKDEILRVVNDTAFTAYSIPRSDVQFGRLMNHGGWEKDSVVRLFRKSALQHWEGLVHEHAVIEGQTGTLEQTLVHLTHRNFISGLRKSADWTPMEAKLLFEANHPKMSILRLLKVMVDEFLYRYIWCKGYKDGIEGGIEAITQSVNRFFVYEQLWELQRKPSLEKTYQQIEQEVVKLWEKEKK